MIDILAFSPHPDDSEMSAGGTLLNAKRAGKTIGIVDLTDGEMSTRGTLESRKQEIEEANKILDLDLRLSLHFADARFENNELNRIKIMNVIREHQPKTILLPYFIDRHPDHERCAKLVKEANFYAGLKKFESLFPSYRATNIYYYMTNTDFAPTFTVDVSSVFEEKMNLFKAYGSQFAYSQSSNDSQTVLSRPEFIEYVIGRARFYGEKSGVHYAEAFYSDKLPLKVI